MSRSRRTELTPADPAWLNHNLYIEKGAGSRSQVQLIDKVGFFVSQLVRDRSQTQKVHFCRIAGSDPGRYEVLLTLVFPRPDEIVDWTAEGDYSAKESFPRPLTLRFDYKGHFWQGVFGRAGLDIIIKARRDAEPWTDLNALLQSVKLQQMTHNQATKNEKSRSREVWGDPYLSQLNGTPCVQQYVQVGNYPREEIHYYFPLDEDHAVEVVVLLVDNSERPGLAKSDWRPRAEAFIYRLLYNIKIAYRPNESLNRMGK